LKKGEDRSSHAQGLTEFWSLHGTFSWLFWRKEFKVWCKTKKGKENGRGIYTCQWWS
jgi:hypothetical protein